MVSGASASRQQTSEKSRNRAGRHPVSRYARPMMTICLSHTTALEVLRCWNAPRLLERGRRRESLPAPERMPDPSWAAATLARLEPLSAVSTPHHVIVSGETARHRSELLVAHQARRRYPPGSFFSLAPDVLCATPELVALQMAEYASDLELLLLVDELCGHYGIQPRAAKGLVRRRDPITSVDGIIAYLDLMGPCRGGSKLRRALARARERSGSPRESKTVHRLEFSPRLGGYGLEVVGLNDPVLVERAGAALGEAQERIRKPDIMLLAPADAPLGSIPFRGCALDYQGEYHRDEAQKEKDTNRRNELLACGIKPYEIEKDHYDDPGYLDWLVSRIRRDLGIEEPSLGERAREARRARRERLRLELDRADGLTWTGRAEPLLMEGSRALARGTES